MAERRPKKVWKLNYWKLDPEMAAQVSILGNPSEVRMSAGDDKFISVRSNGITLAPGIGNSVNIQGMSQNFKYAGLLSDLPFPMSIMPVTIATPFPKQIIVPPLVQQIETIRELTAAASILIGV